MMTSAKYRYPNDSTDPFIPEIGGGSGAMIYELCHSKSLSSVGKL
ncbi:MAG: hypothetical protein AAFR24_13775 [Cyanobacteria bacterium J06627_3]